MAKEKISELTAAGTLTGAELIPVVQDGETVQTTAQDIAALGGAGASYLVYVALLSQSGTDAPVATILENTIGGTVVWSYVGTGNYIAELTGAFTVNKTWFSTLATNDGDDFLAAITHLSANSIRLYVLTSSNTGTDDWAGISIEIRVYP